MASGMPRGERQVSSMDKVWRYRLFSWLSALLIAGTSPASVFAAPAGDVTVIHRDGTAQDGPGTGGDGASQTAGAQEQTLPVAATEEEIDAFFDGSVFVGDSVMMGFRNYAVGRRNTYLGRMQFLASGSFSVHNALWPVGGKSVHPIFQGQQRPVWESLGMLQAKKVFLFFGLNDMNMGTLQDTCACYAQVIANIKANCPDAQIHVISMTYTLRGKGKGNLQNDNIRMFNELLKQMALENGWGFMDLATPLSDANGDLAPAYCSDNYVHQTTAAYDVWSLVLREYARSQIEGTCAYPADGVGKTAQQTNEGQQETEGQQTEQ